MLADKLDPYLAIARGSGFVDHFAPPMLDDAVLELIVELEPVAGSVDKLLSFASGTRGVAVSAAHVAAGSTFLTVRATAGTLDALAGVGGVRRVVCAHPVRHQRPQLKPLAPLRGYKPPLRVARDLRGPMVDTKRALAAVIDHGCPFAHRQLRSGELTRVVALWDQDKSLDGAFPGRSAPAGFGYGRELRQDQLQDLIDATRSADGGIDEARCYRQARYDAMEVDLTHGSHVLGLFVGPAYPLAGRRDVAPTTDVAFIQLPRDVLQTPSQAIDRCILDGLRYLRDFAHTEGYGRCVVVCAYGSYLGPHDGSSVFERAVDAFLDEGPTEFDLVFPAGNCADLNLHAVLRPRQGKPAEVQWQLPADNEAPSYAELWVGPGARGFEVHVELAGVPIEIRTTRNRSLPDWLHAIRQEQPDGQTVVVLRAGPTKVSDGVTPKAPSGRLGLRVVSEGDVDEVHAYACWGGDNVGFERFTRQASWSLPANYSGPSEIAPRGTILGSGCGGSRRLHVVGGFADHRDPTRRARAPYSSIGPSRGARLGPDFLAMTEGLSPYRGIPGPGTRSGFEFRMWGTSVAAPQAARAILNRALVLVPPSSTTPPQVVEELGDGFLV